jgi:hypothetical protein
VAEDDDNEDVISDGNRNQGGSGSYASKFVPQLQRQIYYFAKYLKTNFVTTLLSPLKGTVAPV